MDVCEFCRGTQKCQSCGGTGIGVLETMQNIGDTDGDIPKLPSLSPCLKCRGTGKCPACTGIATTAITVDAP